MAHVQSRSAQGNGVVSIALAFTSNVTAGSLLVVGGSNWGRTFGTSSCSDSRGQTYTRDVTGSNGSPTIGVYSTPNAAAGATTVTLTATGTTDDISIAIHEYSGMATSSPADQARTGTGTGTTHSSGATGTTTQANELVFAVGTHNGSNVAVSAGSGYLLRQSQTSAVDMPIATEDKTVTATGTQTATFTWDNAAYVVGIVTYKEAGGGGGGGGFKAAWARSSNVVMMPGARAA